MDEQANVDLVRQCYDAFKQGDLDRLLGCMAEDIDWELPAIPGVPFSGKRHGRDQVTEFFRLEVEHQIPREFTPQDFIAQGERVVAVGHYAFSVKSTGEDYESDWTHIFTIRNGKIAAFREFLDTRSAALAFQPQGAGMLHAQGTQPGPQPSVH